MKIRITSKRDGFRRGGISHSAEPTDYPFDKFNKKQLADLKAETMLIVEEIEVKEPNNKPKNKPKAKPAETVGKEDGKTNEDNQAK
ncbi:MAG: hypothetical protein KAJ75_03675 [Alphaproteobacteria bacterium]|nr:hypothetical protein [Alphaproteobacteria bacterium]